MATQPLRLLLAALGLVALLVPAAAAQDSALSKADRDAFAWFDGLGYPSTAGRPFVRITRTAEEPKPDEEPWTTAGFLLAETPESWTLLGADLFPDDVQRKENGYRATREPAELREIAVECLAAIREQVRTGSRGGLLPGVERLLDGPVGSLDSPAGAFVLARRCAENGLEELARDILMETRRLATSGYRRTESPEFLEQVQQDIAEHALARITLDHGDTTVARPRLLADYRSWLRRFPASPLRERTAEDARILESMIVEDGKHAAIADDQLAALPATDRVRELIHRLRDQQGHQMSSPGSPSIYDLGIQFGKGRKIDTPAGQLEAMGMQAVPALIDALEDPRFTRALGFHRWWSFRSCYVVRVGDAARDSSRTSRARCSGRERQPPRR